MASLKIRKRILAGLNRLVTTELHFVCFSLLWLRSGESFEEQLREWEAGIVILRGECEVKAGAVQGVLGPRVSVFSDLPSGLYIPAESSYRLTARRESELALCYGPGAKGGEAVLISPPELVIHERGRPGFQRTVRDVLVNQVKANSLLVGETVNRAGEWSSYPPHKHDTALPGVESELEEIYFFKVNPPLGFGLQRVYTADRSLDEAIPVEENDVVILPRGYHPVAAAPGYEVYYLWALAGPERKMQPHDDPAHAWVLTA